MVDVQFGDDGQHRLDDVGAVESSAQAYLNHGQVDGFCFEMNKSSRGDGFKEGWFKVDTLGGFCNFGDDVTKGGFVDFYAADRDALTNIDEVRTGVTTDGVPNATHHVVDHVRDRSLAIGSGDVDACTLSCGLPNACINFCMRSSFISTAENRRRRVFSKSTNWFNHRLRALKSLRQSRGSVSCAGIRHRQNSVPRLRPASLV